MSDVMGDMRFIKVGADGLGRASATTAHAMAYFNGDIYLGTSTGHPKTKEDAPRIYRYRPSEDRWTVVFEPPMVPGTKRAGAPDRQFMNTAGGNSSLLGSMSSIPDFVPRDVGYRSMTVFQGPSDPAPALYVGSMSRDGGIIYRSLDGEHFEPVTEPGMGNPDCYSLRGLTAYKGKMFTAPAGTITDDHLDRNVAPDAKVYVSDDPALGRWVPASLQGLGDENNGTIYSLGVAHGRLYAGTENAKRGFQVWCTEAEGEPPYEWKPVIIDGAFGYNHNLAVSAMVEFNGALYVGSGISGLGHDTINDIGPASCELIRIWPDHSWDLISGTPRFTPDGLKVPLSLLGPGMGDFYNSVVWTLGVHDGCIYMGTHQWEVFQSIKNNAETVVGGYQLWRSRDGESWEKVLDDGDGNPAEVGIRTLVSTPLGLFIGSHNQGRLVRMAGLRRKDLNFPSGFSVLLGFSGDENWSGRR